MSQLTYSKYPFLKDLGIQETNFGCYYDKKWVGNGSTTTILNPSTNEPIAKVKMANADDYEAAV